MKNIYQLTLLLLLFLLAASSCVSKRKYLASQAALEEMRQKYSGDSSMYANRVASQNQSISDLEARKAALQKEIENLNNEKNNISKNASEALSAQQRRIENLQSLIAQQRKATRELREKMSNALQGFSPSDLTVSEKNGKVYVSLSENLLFPSGSAVVNPKGKDALSKLAAVLIINPDIAINIEGHTDSIPIRGKYQDNWALSTARAASIVRVLTNNYKVDPVRIIASGHSWYDPVDVNSSADGRAKNRRTEIILIPKLDELYRLMEQGGV
jgi:chemotaxis protein MotB